MGTYCIAQGAQLCVFIYIKNPSVNAEDIRDMGLIPVSGRSLGEGHGNPLQYSCLENPMDRAVFWDTVHRVSKSRTWLKQLNIHAYTYTFNLNSIPINNIWDYLFLVSKEYVVALLSLTCAVNYLLLCIRCLL